MCVPHRLRREFLLWRLTETAKNEQLKSVYIDGLCLIVEVTGKLHQSGKHIAVAGEHYFDHSRMLFADVTQ